MAKKKSKSKWKMEMKDHPQLTKPEAQTIAKQEVAKKRKKK